IDELIERHIPGVAPQKVDLNSLLEKARGSRPDIAGLEAFERAAKANLSAVRLRTWIPELTGFASFGGLTGGQGSSACPISPTAEVAIGAGWTIHGLGIGEFARHRKAKAEARAAELRVRGQQEEVRYQVTRTWRECNVLRDRIIVSKKR